MRRSSSSIWQPDLQTQSGHDEISDDQIRAAAENRRPRFYHEAGVWRSEQNQTRCLIYRPAGYWITAYEAAAVRFRSKRRGGIKLSEILMTPPMQAAPQFPIAAQLFTSHKRWCITVCWRDLIPGFLSPEEGLGGYKRNKAFIFIRKL